MKELLHYARILVEVSIDEELPETISFENEWEGIQHYEVQYEWKPIKCRKCSMFGHCTDDYKKGNVPRVWKEKARQKDPLQQQQQQHDLIPHRLGKEPTDVPMGNSFDTLQAVNLPNSEAWFENNDDSEP